MKKNDPVSHIMSRNLVTLEVSDPISKARQLFETAKVHHLPIVKSGELQEFFRGQISFALASASSAIRT